MSAERYGLYVTREMHRKIKILAAQEGVSVREMVERLIGELETQRAGNETHQDREPDQGKGPGSR